MAKSNFEWYKTHNTRVTKTIFSRAAAIYLGHTDEEHVEKWKNKEFKPGDVFYSILPILYGLEEVQEGIRDYEIYNNKIYYDGLAYARYTSTWYDQRKINGKYVGRSTTGSEFPKNDLVRLNYINIDNIDELLRELFSYPTIEIPGIKTKLVKNNPLKEKQVG